MQHLIDIPAYRLYNQGLSKNQFNHAADVVRDLGAVQAQDFAGAKWAIALRSHGLSEPDVQRAFDDGSILRTHVMRPTWHFVAPEDIRWMLALTAPRVLAQMAFMDRQLELEKAILKKSNAALLKVLQGGKQLTRAEIEAEFQKTRIPAQGQRLGHLLMHAELEGIICSGQRRGRQFTYALLEERVPPAKSLRRDESLAKLVKRYFQTRGPATLQDFAWWSGLTLTDAKVGVELVKSAFVSEALDGQRYWFSETAPTVPQKSPVAYLLPNYDEFVVSYKDRSAIGKAAAQAGIERNDQALLANVVLLDGQVIGGWKRTLEKEKVQVETSLFMKLDTREEQALVDATECFGKFLGLPVLLLTKEYSIEQRTTRSF